MILSVPQLYIVVAIASSIGFVAAVYRFEPSMENWLWKTALLDKVVVAPDFEQKQSDRVCNISKMSINAQLVIRQIVRMFERKWMLISHPCKNSFCNVKSSARDPANWSNAAHWFIGIVPSVDVWRLLPSEFVLSKSWDNDG